MFYTYLDGQTCNTFTQFHITVQYINEFVSEDFQETPAIDTRHIRERLNVIILIRMIPKQNVHCVNVYTKFYRNFDYNTINFIDENHLKLRMVRAIINIIVIVKKRWK